MPLVTRIGCAVRKLPGLTLRHGGRRRRILRDHLVQDARDTIGARNTTVRNWSCSDPVISPVIGDAKILVAGVMALLVDLREVILDEQQRAASTTSTPTKKQQQASLTAHLAAREKSPRFVETATRRCPFLLGKTLVGYR